MYEFPQSYLSHNATNDVLMGMPGLPQIFILLIAGLLTGLGIRSYRRRKAARLEEMKKAAFNEGRLQELEKKGAEE